MCDPPRFIAFNSLRSIALGEYPYLYLVKGLNYTGTPTITVAYYALEPYVIQPEKKLLLIFAAIDVSSTSWRWESYPWKGKGVTESTGITVSLFYKKCDIYDQPIGELLGQTINTQAIIFTGAP